MSYDDPEVYSLEALSHYLKGLESIVPDIATRAKPKVEALIEEEFATGKDPYGRNWAPLAKATIAKGRKPPPLTDTGKMRASVDVQPTSYGLHISVLGPSRYHQLGTEHMWARPILPMDKLPPRWIETIEQATSEALASKGGK